MARRATKEGVPKVDTLGVLEGAGTISTQEYAYLLAEEGFEGTYYRAHRLLIRFLVQGLVGTTEKQKMVEYTLRGHGSTTKEPVTRRQRIVLWTITKKGRDRLKWLRDHVSHSEPGFRDRKGGRKRKPG